MGFPRLLGIGVLAGGAGGGRLDPQRGDLPRFFLQGPGSGPCKCGAHARAVPSGAVPWDIMYRSTPQHSIYYRVVGHGSSTCDVVWWGVVSRASPSRGPGARKLAVRGGEKEPGVGGWGPRERWRGSSTIWSRKSRHSILGLGPETPNPQKPETYSVKP